MLLGLRRARVANTALDATVANLPCGDQGCFAARFFLIYVSATVRAVAAHMVFIATHEGSVVLIPKSLTL